ncbi:MAG: class I tRNA ligase family protein, partial [Actinomycetota bacterium]
YHFAWDEVCDWYLELVKDSFAKGGGEADKSKRFLGHVLDQILRLMQTIMKFIY